MLDWAEFHFSTAFFSSLSFSRPFDKFLLDSRHSSFFFQKKTRRTRHNMTSFFLSLKRISLFSGFQHELKVDRRDLKVLCLRPVCRQGQDFDDHDDFFSFREKIGKLLSKMVATQECVYQALVTTLTWQRIFPLFDLRLTFLSTKRGWKNFPAAKKAEREKKKFTQPPPEASIRTTLSPIHVCFHFWMLWFQLKRETETKKKGSHGPKTSTQS